MSTQTPKKNRFRWGNVLVFLMLVGLPLGSYVYLQKGYDYRKTVLSELEELGPMPKDLIKLSSQPDSVLVPDSAFVIASYLPLSDGKALEAMRPQFEKLGIQFANRSDVYFVFFYDETEASRKLNNFVAASNLTEVERLRCIPITAAQQSKILQPSGWQRPADNPPILLSDRNGVVRKHYAAQNPVEVERLVHHLAVLLPQEKKAKARVVRETTK